MKSKFTIKLDLALVLIFLVASYTALKAEKSPQTFPKDCSTNGNTVYSVDYVDTDNDGRWDRKITNFCDLTLPPLKEDIKPPLSFIPTSSYGLIDPGATRMGLDIDFYYEVQTPLGNKIPRIVSIWNDSLAGKCGIEYSSLAKDSAGYYLAFYSPTQVPNPNNIGWTFADVHGTPFYDASRGTLVNELYENITNALVGIQYFPASGPAITFFFYPKN